jgi:hypothetical protein
VHPALTLAVEDSHCCMMQLQTKGNDMLDLPVLMPLVISFAAIYLFFRWVVFDMNSPK